jgi:hypothetical protein
MFYITFHAQSNIVTHPDVQPDKSCIQHQPFQHHDNEAAYGYPKTKSYHHFRDPLKYSFLSDLQFRIISGFSKETWLRLRA